MKKLIFSTLLIIPFISIGQLISGPLLDEGRKLLTSSTFIIEDLREGVLFFNVAVDRTGNVASARVDPSGSTVISTPARIIATNYLRALKFEPGTYYPEFHQVRIKVTLKTPIAPKTTQE